MKSAIKMKYINKRYVGPKRGIDNGVIVPQRNSIGAIVTSKEEGQKDYERNAYN